MNIEEMKSVDVRTVNPEELVDITQISIDENMDKEQRIKDFAQKIKNPYCFRVGDIIVKNVYSNDGVSLKERFEQFARTL